MLDPLIEHYTICLWQNTLKLLCWFNETRNFRSPACHVSSWVLKHTNLTSMTNDLTNNFKMWLPCNIIISIYQLLQQLTLSGGFTFARIVIEYTAWAIIITSCNPWKSRVCVTLQNQPCLLLFSEYKQIKEVMFWQRRFVCLFVCG